MACRTLTGAWIEALQRRFAERWPAVAPSRVRGLKRFLLDQRPFDGLVAPSRVRGLKPVGIGDGHDVSRVAPSRVRGLKPVGLRERLGHDGSHPHGCVD